MNDFIILNNIRNTEERTSQLCNDTWMNKWKIVCFGLVVLMAYQLFLGYLMPKPLS